MKIDNQPNDYNIINARVVAPERVLDRGAVRIESGLLTDIRPDEAGHRPRRCKDILDTRGCLLLPGFVDIYADSLEMAIASRPVAPFSTATVLSTHDAELTLYGITTDFHCVGLAVLRAFAKPHIVADAVSVAPAPANTFL